MASSIVAAGDSRVDSKVDYTDEDSNASDYEISLLYRKPLRLGLPPPTSIHNSLLAGGRTCVVASGGPLRVVLPEASEAQQGDHDAKCFLWGLKDYIGAVTSDGKTIGFARGRVVRLYNITDEGCNEARVLRTSVDATSLALLRRSTSDRTLLVATGTPRGVHVRMICRDTPVELELNDDPRETEPVVLAQSFGISCVSFSPNNQLLLVVTDAGGLGIWLVSELVDAIESAVMDLNSAFPVRGAAATSSARKPTLTAAWRAELPNTSGNAVSGLSFSPKSNNMFALTTWSSTGTPSCFVYLRNEGVDALPNSIHFERITALEQRVSTWLESEARASSQRPDRFPSPALAAFAPCGERLCCVWRRSVGCFHVKQSDEVIKEVLQHDGVGVASFSSSLASDSEECAPLRNVLLLSDVRGNLYSVYAGAGLVPGTAWKRPSSLEWNEVSTRESTSYKLNRRSGLLTRGEVDVSLHQLVGSEDSVDLSTAQLVPLRAAGNTDALGVALWWPVAGGKGSRLIVWKDDEAQPILQRFSKPLPLDVYASSANGLHTSLRARLVAATCGDAGCSLLQFACSGRSVKVKFHIETERWSLDA